MTCNTGLVLEYDCPRNTCARCELMDVDEVSEKNYVMKIKHIHDRDLNGELNWPASKSLSGRAAVLRLLGVVRDRATPRLREPLWGTTVPPV